MHDTSARLVERVLPAASYRQWVLTVPFPLRLRIARDPGELSRVLNLFHTFTHYVKVAFFRGTSLRPRSRRTTTTMRVTTSGPVEPGSDLGEVARRQGSQDTRGASRHDHADGSRTAALRSVQVPQRATRKPSSRVQCPSRRRLTLQRRCAVPGDEARVGRPARRPLWRDGRNMAVGRGPASAGKLLTSALCPKPVQTVRAEDPEESARCRVE